MMTLVDGTLIAALPKLMQTSVLKSQIGSGMVKWRLHIRSTLYLPPLPSLAALSMSLSGASLECGEDVCERGKVGRNSVVRFLLAC